MSTLERLARYYERTGQPPYRLAGSLWVAESAMSIMSGPGCQPLRPALAEVRAMLRKAGKIAAVFPCAPKTGVEVASWFVRDRGFGLHSLQRQFRQHVVGARRHCECRPVSWRELSALGLPVNQAASLRRGTHHPRFVEPAGWANYCEAAEELGLEANGTFVDGELAAYMSTWTFEGICHGMHMFWDPRFHASHPTHAFYFHTVSDRMARPEVASTSVGHSAIPAMPKVDHFKGHAGFVREPIRMGIVLHPALAPVFTNGAWRGGWRRLRERLGRRWPLLYNSEVFDVAAATRLPLE